MALPQLRTAMAHELSSKVSAPARHKTFYFHNVTFEVNDTLFRVPSAGLETRGIFKTLFALPSNDEEGRTDTKPIKLEALRTKDFESLLKVIFSFDLSTPILSDSEWIGVLRLSTMWEMTDLRGKSITNLRQLAAMDKVLLGKEFRVKEWLLRGYESLIDDSLQNPAQWETWNLDWETKARLLSVREQALRRIKKNCSHCGRGVTQSESSGTTVDDLKIAFQAEIRDIERDHLES